MGIVYATRGRDSDGKPINDDAGVQCVPSGDTVVASPHAGRKDVKLSENTRDKKIVWNHKDETKPGIRHFQILETVKEGGRRRRLRRRGAAEG